MTVSVLGQRLAISGIVSDQRSPRGIRWPGSLAAGPPPNTHSSTDTETCTDTDTVTSTGSLPGPHLGIASLTPPSIGSAAPVVNCDRGDARNSAASATAAAGIGPVCIAFLCR